MSFHGSSEGGNPNKMDLGEPRRFGGGMDMDKTMSDDRDDSRFDSGRGRRPPFGRGGGGRRLSPPGRDRSRDFGGFGREDSMRDRSPMRAPEDRYRKDDMGFSGRDDPGRKGSGRPYFDDRDRFDGRSRLDSSSNFKSRFDGPGDPYKSRSMNFPGTPPPPGKGTFNDGFPKPNECEIIAVNKHQRDYAESVEARIKRMGILVDILFLVDEALLTQTIDDIARRGSLYAMVISPQNEQHGSVTVNILHGTPQEHRNMPLEDALKLLGRNFQDHIRMQREKMERERAERGPYVGNVAADKEIQLLLRMLADGRWVSTQEITSVITYLSERRDKMQSANLDDNPGRAPLPVSDIKRDTPFKPKVDDDIAKKEQDLQNRIMNIMNQGAPSASQSLDLPRPNPPRMSPGMGSMRPPSTTGTKNDSLDDILPKPQGLDSNRPNFPSTPAGSNLPGETTSPSTFINFDNASVQKALDNLMQSGPNLLKNISMTTPNLSEPPPSTLSGSTPKPAGEVLGMQRGNMGPSPRGGMADLPPSRGPGNLPGLSDGPNRGPGNMGPSRGPGGMGGGPGQQRGPGSDMMGGMDRGGYGGMSDMGSQRGYGNGPDSGMGRGMSDMGRMGTSGSSQGPDLARSGSFPGQGSVGNFPGSGPSGNFGGQKPFGNYPGSGQPPFNSGMGGNLGRPNFGGGQGMGGMGGGPPRRY